ncbi:erythromycin esterase family protein [Nitrosococcus wardiae]|uniref:Erythromycin esterase family protein n=1 Tax=Nitrosococcus wardiae TaxID=1814290 RepID=A0A4P7BXS5_9GAMM|nr:erythromycin esterase family protein [Nitrosococcus wardiae]QBQ54978.1 erythromycin esterase family protein [Nitrosococcus wardiae]
MVGALSKPEDAIQQQAYPFQGKWDDYDPLMELIGDKSFILLGEATHGTHEFYATRAEITQRLILEQDLNAVAVEADWPSAYRLNRYVRGLGKDSSAQEAMSDFRRFPLWMWRNTVIHNFIEWLREYNQQCAPAQQVGFYGLDLYSLYESVAVVLDYLQKVDPEAAEEARKAYECLDHRGDEQRYGSGVMLGLRRSCEDEVVQQLIALRHNALDYVQRNGMAAADEQFQAEQNARLIKNAEAYYRGLFSRRVNTWNIRDQHMSNTLNELHQHLSAQAGRNARIAVWEHNSHLGDARATEMGRQGELNVGQLTRERHGSNCVLIGFTTYTGTVAAASSWDGPVERKLVRPALAESFEDLFHRTGLRRFLLIPCKGSAEVLREWHLERAIGVLYLPETERASHYFYARMADQFDAVLHFDQTQALEPLDTIAEWERGEEETYPFGV